MTSLSPDSTSARPPYKNILIVRQHDQLGDMLCAVPLMRALRLSSPSARITLVTRPVNHAIMLNHPYVDDVMEYDKGRLLSSRDGIVSLLKRLRSTRYDLAVVPATVSVSSTSNLIARASGAKERIGPGSLEGKKSSTAWCFTRTVDLNWSGDPHRHQTLRNLEIVSSLGIVTDDLSHLIGLTAAEKQDARSQMAQLRAKHRLLIGFHPGAGKPPNRWSARNFGALADYAASHYGAGIVITQGPMDDEPIREMLTHMRHPHILLKNKPVREIAAIIDQLDIYATNDTGVMHIAGATSPRVLALFGPTDPLQWAPMGRKNRYLLGKKGTIDSLSFEEVRDALEMIVIENSRELKLA